MSLAEIAKALKDGKAMLSHEDAESFEGGGVFVKVMVLSAGQSVVTHSHKYDHLHILGQGKVIIETPESMDIYKAPAVITIKKDTHHGITAVEDSIGFCVHNTSEIEAEPFKG